MVDVRRHSVLLSDKELVLVERALSAYAQVIRIQTTTNNKQPEADLTARVSSVVQGHRHCTCPVPIEGGS